MAAVDITSGLVLIVPAGLASLAAITAAHIVPPGPRRTRREREPVDLMGAVTVTTGLMALVYGVSHASTSSWSDDLTLGVLTADASR